MANQYSISQARDQLSDIVDQAESGAEVELTRRGRSVAVVVSVAQYQRLRGERPQFDVVYARFLKRHPLDRIGLEDDFVEELRDRRGGRRVDL